MNIMAVKSVGRGGWVGGWAGVGGELSDVDRAGLPGDKHDGCRHVHWCHLVFLY